MKKLIIVLVTMLVEVALIGGVSYLFDWAFIDILFLGALAIFGAVWLYSWNTTQLRNELHATDKGYTGVSCGEIRLFEFKICPVRLGMLLFLIITFAISVYEYYPYFI